jgi:hypothetical protein
VAVKEGKFTDYEAYISRTQKKDFIIETCNTSVEVTAKARHQHTVPPE